MTFRKIGLFNIIFVAIIAVMGQTPTYELLLTCAQLVFVPLVLHMIYEQENSYAPKFLLYTSILGFLSVVVLQVTGNYPFLSIFNFLFTIILAFYGLKRILARGLVHMEELNIDFGLIYLAMGGAWFVAYQLGIDTGFSPMLTWLTAIHFHYSAFLLPIFVGFLGRIYQPKLYTTISFIILIAPMVVALGITFSARIEMASVLLYIVGIYGLISFSFKASFVNRLQKYLIRLSFTALGITILFSLYYAYGNLTEQFTISIDGMLRFHGFTNAVLFAFIGIVGWGMAVPKQKRFAPGFPMSKLRGTFKIGNSFLDGRTDNSTYRGLVDDMKIYEPFIGTHTLSSMIQSFYERTEEYRLFANVKWRHWFIPFASIYRLISKRIEQINLPLSMKSVEMTGDIHSIVQAKDGRENPRAWVRKVEEETVFVALYSEHQSKGRTYMNIALPLPFSTMIGILELNQQGKALQLTSKKSMKQNDSGIYFAIRNFLIKLPIEEDFRVEEENGVLKATHKMWIFSIPFLSIHYKIMKKDSNG